MAYSQVFFCSSFSVPFPNHKGSIFPVGVQKRKARHGHVGRDFPFYEQ